MGCPTTPAGMVQGCMQAKDLEQEIQFVDGIANAHHHQDIAAVA
jgi:hypothetical protein